MRRRLAQVLGFSVGAWLAGLAGSAPALAFETELLQNSGPGANRVNIFILGDGYRAEDQTLLRNRAIALANDFWVHTPFAVFRPFFNVKLIKTISADDGAVNGFNPPSQPTIFQSFFNCGGTDRLLCIGDTARLDQVLQADAPEYNPAFDIVLVTVNDLKYGGAGSAQYATTSADPNASSVAVHEIGHSFADLADEYEDVNPPSTTEFTSPNATIFSQRSQVKWNVWISASTPVPTPELSGFDNTVGVFEGAVYSSVGHFRPWENCVMRVLGVTFCPVCSEALVWSVYDKTDPIEAHVPAAASLTLALGASQSFSFTGPKPVPNTQNVTWFRDGVQFASGVTSVNVTGMQLGVGTHTVRGADAGSDDAGAARSQPLAAQSVHLDGHRAHGRWRRSRRRGRHGGRRWSRWRGRGGGCRWSRWRGGRRRSRRRGRGGGYGRSWRRGRRYSGRRRSRWFRWSGWFGRHGGRRRSRRPVGSGRGGRRHRTLQQPVHQPDNLLVAELPVGQSRHCRHLPPDGRQPDRRQLRQLRRRARLPHQRRRHHLQRRQRASSAQAQRRLLLPVDRRRLPLGLLRHVLDAVAGSATR